MFPKILWLKYPCIQSFVFIWRKFALKDWTISWLFLIMIGHSKLIFQNHRAFVCIFTLLVYMTKNSFKFKLVIFKWIMPESLFKSIFSITSKLIPNQKSSPTSCIVIHGYRRTLYKFMYWYFFNCRLCIADLCEPMSLLA